MMTIVLMFFTAGNKNNQFRGSSIKDIRKISANQPPLSAQPLPPPDVRTWTRRILNIAT